MTQEETLIVERLKRTVKNVEELQQAFDSVADQLVKTEQQLRDCKALCARAANALENILPAISGIMKITIVPLIAELRKAAE